MDTSSQDFKYEDFCIRIYDTVYLNSGEILRTTSEFQTKEWFNNIAVTSAKNQKQYSLDEEVWYGKVSNI